MEKPGYYITIVCKSPQCCAEWRDSLGVTIGDAYTNAMLSGWQGSEMRGLKCPTCWDKASSPAPME